VLAVEVESSVTALEDLPARKVKISNTPASPCESYPSISFVLQALLTSSSSSLAQGLLVPPVLVVLRSSATSHRAKVEKSLAPFPVSFTASNASM